MSNLAHRMSAADPFERIADLLPQFAARAAEHDQSDTFVAENYAALASRRLMSAAVPVELGGDGLELTELSRLIRAISRACGSTGLAYSMHTHVTALLAWRWRHQKAPVDAVLARIAKEQIVIISSGGSDWIESSGTARKVDGGFAIDATKGFASGVPAGALLNTSAVYDDPQGGATVLHFMVPLSAKEVTIEPSWRAMGMRATGSHLVHIKGFVVPEGAVSLRRPRGRWHPLFDMIMMVALPLIYSAYFGVAEAARDAALACARRRPATPLLVDLVGALETEMAGARMALDDMIAGHEPNRETSNRVFLARANLVRCVLAVADKALEIANGAGYLRTSPIERHFRELQAARFHPGQPYAQREFSGRFALGLDVDAA
jgi:alkylation response protein AidB-like acyl-CoA dehydrogenase